MDLELKSAFESWRDSVIAEVAADGAEKRLQQWLEGYSLPRIDNYTEGHGWLLEAVKDVPGLGDTLARLAAQLLQLHLDGRLKSSNSNRLLFNLFYLCAGLHQPSILWGLLLDAMNSRAVTGNGPENEAANYRGITLVTALRAALVENQRDGRLHPTWRAMLDGNAHDVLDGTPMDGFEGVLGLPGKPNHNEIGYALACTAGYLNRSPLREKQFTHLLRTITMRFTAESWDFRKLAILIGWPTWTVKPLKELYSLDKILYHVIYDGLDGFDGLFVEPQKSGMTFTVHLDPRYPDVGPVAEQMVADFQKCSLPMHHLENTLRPMAMKAHG
jgi:hypothetical protein